MCWFEVSGFTMEGRGDFDACEFASIVGTYASKHFLCESITLWAPSDYNSAHSRWCSIRTEPEFLCYSFFASFFVCVGTKKKVVIRGTTTTIASSGRSSKTMRCHRASIKCWCGRAAAPSIRHALRLCVPNNVHRTELCCLLSIFG